MFVKPSENGAPATAVVVVDGTVVVGITIVVVGATVVVAATVVVGATVVVVATVVVLVFSFAVSYIIAIVIDKTMGLRVAEMDELQGLDITQHAESAYA